MISGNKIGDYLGRKISVASSFSVFDDLADSSLSHAMVLIWLSSEHSLKEMLLQLGKLAIASPLVLFIGGCKAEIAFDALLLQLSENIPSAQILTRFSDEEAEECIEEFIKGTWPSEDRMDSWTAYWIFTDGTESAETISTATMQILEMR